MKELISTCVLGHLVLQSKKCCFASTNQRKAVKYHSLPQPASLGILESSSSVPPAACTRNVQQDINHFRLSFSKENLLYSVCGCDFFSVQLFLTFWVGLSFTVTEPRAQVFFLCVTTLQRMGSAAHPGHHCSCCALLFFWIFFFKKPEAFSLCGFAIHFFFPKQQESYH